MKKSKSKTAKTDGKKPEISQGIHSPAPTTNAKEAYILPCGSRWGVYSIELERKGIYRVASALTTSPVTLDEAKTFCEKNHLPYTIHHGESGITIGEMALQPKLPITEPKIRPSELARLAVDLASMYGQGHDPRHYFAKAHQVIQEAQAYLESVAKEQKVFRFEELIRPLSDKPTGRKKKESTLLGITTPRGLEKALKREFPFLDFVRIMARRELTQHEVELLLFRISSRRQAAGVKGAKKVP